MAYYQNQPQYDNSTFFFTRSEGKPAIFCKECRTISTDPMHVKLMYCPTCRAFHGKLMRQKIDAQIAERKK